MWNIRNLTKIFNLKGHWVKTDENYVHMKTCPQMFTAALFIIAKKEKQFRRPPTKWMDKQLVVYPYNGIPFGNKKEWNIDTY